VGLPSYSPNAIFVHLLVPSRRCAVLQGLGISRSLAFDLDSGTTHYSGDWVALLSFLCSALYPPGCSCVLTLLSSSVFRSQPLFSLRCFLVFMRHMHLERTVWEDLTCLLAALSGVFFVAEERSLSGIAGVTGDIRFRDRAIVSGIEQLCGIGMGIWRSLAETCGVEWDGRVFWKDVCFGRISFAVLRGVRV